MTQSKLSFPRPPARPDQAPDFSGIVIPPAGSLPVPPLDLAAADARPFAVGLVGS